jgi:hypothetical protein
LMSFAMLTLIPTTDDQKTILDDPAASTWWCQWQLGKMRSCIVTLSVLDSVVSSCDADKRVGKAMDELKNFVSKVYENTLKQRSVESYYKEQWTEITVQQMWDIVCRLAFYINCSKLHSICLNK